MFVLYEQILSKTFVNRWAKLRNKKHHTSSCFTDLVQQILKKAQEQQAALMVFQMMVQVVMMQQNFRLRTGVGETVVDASKQVQSEKERNEVYRSSMQNNVSDLVGVISSLADRAARNRGNNVNNGDNETNINGENEKDIMTAMQRLFMTANEEDEKILDIGLMRYRDMMIPAYLAAKSHFGTDGLIITKLVDKVKSWQSYGPVRGQI